MTTVIAARHGDTVIIGSDSLITGASVGDQQKVYHHQDWVLASSGPTFTDHVLRKSMPDAPAYEAALHLRQALVDLGVCEFGEMRIIMVRRRTHEIFLVTEEFSVFPVSEVTAIGTGAEFALGAYHAADIGPDIQSRVAAVRQALHVAEKLDPFTGGQLQTEVL